MPGRVCREFQSGSCTRSDCRFLHQEAERSSTPCRHFRRGACDRGETCRFSHEEVSLNDSVVADLTQLTERLAFQNHTFVDDEKSLLLAISDLSRSREIAFDAEGVSLSRNGPLTVASFLALDKEATAYLVDVQVLGGERVFSSTLPSLRSILENPTVRKVTFDCRGDSDALFHQFGVKLTGVLELQVLDQAVRLQKGEGLPVPSEFVKTGFLQSMAKVAERYLKPHQFQDKQAAPHKDDAKVWEKRPLAPETLHYAANDVIMIKELLIAMRQVVICDELMTGVWRHSARYESFFRETKEAVVDKALRMTEHPIVDRSEFPGAPASSERLTKWDLVVEQLRSKQRHPKLFQDILFILHHDNWYTAASRVYLKDLLQAYSLLESKKRQNLLSELRKRRERNGER